MHKTLLALALLVTSFGVSAKDISYTVTDSRARVYLTDEQNRTCNEAWYRAHVTDPSSGQSVEGCWTGSSFSRDPDVKLIVTTWDFPDGVLTITYMYGDYSDVEPEEED